MQHHAKSSDGLRVCGIGMDHVRALLLKVTACGCRMPAQMCHWT